MSRKEDPKAKDVVSVSIDDFTRTRDNVLMSLANLQAAVSDLSRAYINHANTVLNRGPSADLSNINSITHALFEGGLLGAARPTSPGAKSEVGGAGVDKKKRKRAPPDPNAPKRALTPYFLFMQHNRTRIAEELGANARPKEVADEGTRRWAEMPEPQKEVWKKLYADNLAIYKEKMKAYKAGLSFTDDDNVKAASQLQHEAGVEGSREESDEDEDEESSPEPVKEPTPPRGAAKRRKSGAKEAVASPNVSSSKKGSPEKKKRSAPKKSDKEDAEPKAPGSSRKSVGGEAKRPKKKRKSEVGGDE